MNTLFDSYKKNKDYLICVDSDGCAMDTMDLKHFKAFGPELLPIFNLESYQEKVLPLWNDLNLYQKTRGINRFKGLLMILEIAKENQWLKDDLTALKIWVETTSELSKPSLENEIKVNDSPILKKALEWSLNVNKTINDIKHEGIPYDGVKQALLTIEQKADIAVVSSANGEALEEEWREHGLDQHIEILLGQEAGTKAECIKSLLTKGYHLKNTLMVGDSPGDLDAALSNHIGFFPIIVGKEKESWLELQSTGLEKLTSGTFQGSYQDQLIKSFNDSLHM